MYPFLFIVSSEANVTNILGILLPARVAGKGYGKLESLSLQSSRY